MSVEDQPRVARSNTLTQSTCLVRRHPASAAAFGSTPDAGIPGAAILRAGMPSATTRQAAPNATVNRNSTQLDGSFGFVITAGTHTRSANTLSSAPSAAADRRGYTENRTPSPARN